MKKTKQEFSKRLVMCFVCIFCVHICLTLAVILLSEKGEIASRLYEYSLAIYAAVFGGYLGKAAVENTKKIQQAVLSKVIDTEEENG